MPENLRNTGRVGRKSYQISRPQVQGGLRDKYAGALQNN